jgi:D-threo-aldose 1-dehydrogenase
MQQLTLAGRSTTSLGFGGSLLGSTSPAVSRKLIVAAYEEGIRHFDVAPMYGFGRSEALLREALGSRLRDVTITTKYGLEPPAHSAWIGPLHRLARRVLSPFPKVRTGLHKEPTQAHAGPPLTAAAALQSIDHSLRQLRVETIDLLLLHEATPQRLRDPDLIGTLEECQRAGKIREFGVGSTSERVAACFRDRPAFCRIVQCEWNVFCPDRPVLEGVPHILHGSLGGPRVHFASWLLEDAERCAQWSSALGVDLREPGILNRLLLKASLEKHAGHIVLFSTRTLSNIKSNVQTADDKTLAAPARLFSYLVRSEYLSVPANSMSNEEDLAASGSGLRGKGGEL